MGCSQLVYKQQVAVDELIDDVMDMDGPTFIDRLSANIGAIKIMTRNKSSREVFRTFLQDNTSMGDLDKLLDVYLEFAEIQDLEAEQMGSRTAAIVWRYKLISDEIKKEASEEDAVRPKGMRAEALIWQCLGRLRSLNVVRLRREAIVNLIHIVQHDVLCQLVGPFEQFLDSDKYTKWLKQVAKEEKLSLTHPQEAAPPPMKSSLGIFPKHALESSNILLVDDSVVALKIAGRSLESGGLHVDKATNGQIALKLMLSKRYDVVLIDINMPVLDGFETVRLFRKHERMQQEQYTDDASSTSSISDNEDFDEDEEGGETASSAKRRAYFDVGTGTLTNSKSAFSLEYRKKKRRESFDAYATGDDDNFKSLDDIKDELILRSGGKHHRLINRAFIIGMSNDDSLRKAVNDSEMNYFLSKPFTLDKFMEAVRIGNATNGGRNSFEADEKEETSGLHHDKYGDGYGDNMTDEETPPTDTDEDILTLQQ